MRYLLDTCLISEVVSKKPNPKVVAWLDGRDEDSLFLSVLTLGELQKGVSELPDNDGRKESLQRWVSFDLAGRFEGRILDLNLGAAMIWGQLLGDNEQHGGTLPVMDSLIAATAALHGMIVVTRNVKDMGRCTTNILNPWEN